MFYDIINSYIPIYFSFMFSFIMHTILLSIVDTYCAYNFIYYAIFRKEESSRSFGYKFKKLLFLFS